jgi:hypothetical protein
LQQNLPLSEVAEAAGIGIAAARILIYLNLCVGSSESVLSRLFISHSSKDDVAAIAFKQWLGANGWHDEDVFLDVEDIGGGERWKEALRKAHARCEAVVLLASPEALSSPECLTEIRKAEDFGKEIIIVLLRDLAFDDRRLDSFKERQMVDLAAAPQAHVEAVDYRDKREEVRFNEASRTPRRRPS